MAQQSSDEYLEPPTEFQNGQDASTGFKVLECYEAVLDLASANLNDFFESNGQEKAIPKSEDKSVHCIYRKRCGERTRNNSRRFDIDFDLQTRVLAERIVRTSEELKRRSRSRASRISFREIPAGNFRESHASFVNHLEAARRVSRTPTYSRCTPVHLSTMVNRNTQTKQGKNRRKNRVVQTDSIFFDSLDWVPNVVCVKDKTVQTNTLKKKDKGIVHRSSSCVREKSTRTVVYLKEPDTKCWRKEKSCQVYDQFTRGDLLCMEWVDKYLFRVPVDPHAVVVDGKEKEYSEFTCRSSSMNNMRHIGRIIL